MRVYLRCCSSFISFIELFAVFLSHSDPLDKCTQAERFIIRTADWSILLIAYKSSNLYALEVVGYSVPAEV